MDSPESASLDQRILDFLSEHTYATEITMDEVTGVPIKAVYSNADCTGNIRKEQSVYYFW